VTGDRLSPVRGTWWVRGQRRVRGVGQLLGAPDQGGSLLILLEGPVTAQRTLQGRVQGRAGMVRRSGDERGLRLRNGASGAEFSLRCRKVVAQRAAGVESHVVGASEGEGGGERAFVTAGDQCRRKGRRKTRGQFLTQRFAWFALLQWFTDDEGYSPHSDKAGHERTTREDSAADISWEAREDGQGTQHHTRTHTLSHTHSGGAGWIVGKVPQGQGTSRAQGGVSTAPRTLQRRTSGLTSS